MFRPKYHFTVKEGYMNDPNGLIYNQKTKQYHLFYQYSKKINTDEYFGSWIEKNWGHATSTDLIHFKEEKVVLKHDNIGLIWSGSSLIDRNNALGLFDESVDKEDRFVCAYACANNTPINNYGKICCCIAYSKDGGNNYIKYENNPVIDNLNNKYDEAFGDPKIFYLEDDCYENGGIFVMITVLKVRIFTSTDLKNWHFESEGICDNEPFYSECPDIFKIKINGKDKYVYSGAGKYYIVGEFIHDGNNRLIFKTESKKIEVDRGNLYATQHFYNTKDNRIIQMSWMCDHSSLSLRFLKKKWDGVQSLPLEFNMYKNNDEYEITYYPVKEINAFRKEKSLSLKENKIVRDNLKELKSLALESFDLEAIFDVSETNSFIFEFRKSKDETTRLYYNKEKNEVELNTYLSGLVSHEHHHIKLKLKDNILPLRLIVDVSVIDLFVDNGKQSKSILFYPNKKSQGFKLKVDGKLIIKKFDIYKI